MFVCNGYMGICATVPQSTQGISEGLGQQLDRIAVEQCLEQASNESGNGRHRAVQNARVDATNAGSGAAGKLSRGPRAGRGGVLSKKLQESIPAHSSSGWEQSSAVWRFESIRKLQWGKKASSLSLASPIRRCWPPPRQWHQTGRPRCPPGTAGRGPRRRWTTCPCSRSPSQRSHP